MTDETITTKWLGYAGHYYVTEDGGLDQVMKRMPERVERSGPQLIHFHRATDPCGHAKHTRCDESGSHEVRLGGYKP